VYWQARCNALSPSLSDSLTLALLEHEEKAPIPKLPCSAANEKNPDHSNETDIGETGPSKNGLAWTKVARRRGKNVRGESVESAPSKEVEVTNGPGGSIL
jgi:hypothetical protein